jgi:enterochelin esterase-like enzyme
MRSDGRTHSVPTGVLQGLIKSPSREHKPRAGGSAGGYFSHAKRPLTPDKAGVVCYVSGSGWDPIQDLQY